MSGDVLPAGLSARYEALRKLGEGAHGAVMLAAERGTGRCVAIKRLTRLEDPRALARFERECRLLGEVKNPRVLALIEHGVDSGVPWLVTDWIEGGTLAERLEREETLAPAMAAELVADVLDGLAALHERGIVHRDVKPENVFIDAAGRATVGDLGTARDLATLENLTQSGEVLGTPAYVSPEQVHGEETTAASDVYACGVMLFECIAGAPPFAQGDVYAVLRRHVEETPPRLDALAPAVGPELAELVAAMLAKAPAARPGPADEVARRLRALMGTAATTRVPLLVPTPRRMRRGEAADAVRATMAPGEHRRGRRGVAAVAVAMVVCAGALAWRGSARRVPSVALEDPVALARLAVKSDPTDVHSWQQLFADIAQREGWAAAERACADEAGAIPGRAAPWVGLAAVASARRDPKRGEELLRRALELEPAETRAAVNLANMLAGSGRLPEAETVCRDALTRAPASADLHCNLGAIRFQRGDRAEARREFQMARTLQPDHRLTLDNLGQILTYHGTAREAADHYAHAWKVYPDRVDYACAQAGALTRLNLRDDALRVLDAAIARGPQAVCVWNNRGWVRWLKKDMAGAEADYKRGLTVDPEFGSLHENLARLYLAAGREADADRHIGVFCKPGLMSAHRMEEFAKALDALSEPARAKRVREAAARDAAARRRAKR